MFQNCLADFENPIFTLINAGAKSRFACFGQKKTAAHGVSCLLRSPGGMWIVANGVRKYSPMIDHEVYGDWAHGHYFMENRKKAVDYFIGL